MVIAIALDDGPVGPACGGLQLDGVVGALHQHVGDDEAPADFAEGQACLRTSAFTITDALVPVVGGALRGAACRRPAGPLRPGRGGRCRQHPFLLAVLPMEASIGLRMGSGQEGWRLDGRKRRSYAQPVVGWAGMRVPREPTSEGGA